MRTHLAGKSAALVVAAALLVGVIQANNIPGIMTQAKAATVTESVWDINFDDGGKAPWRDSGTSTTVVDSPFADTAATDGKVLEVANITHDYDGLESPTGVLVPGQTYSASMRVRLAAGGPSSATAHFVLTSGWAWVPGGVTVTADGWTTVEGTFTVPADAVAAEAKLYTAVQPVSGFDLTYYVDDIVVTTEVTVTDQVIWDIPFNDGEKAPWRDSGTSTTVVDSPFVDTAATDGKVLEVANITHDYDGLESPTGVLVPGQTYTASMRVRLAAGGPSSATAHFVLTSGWAWVPGGVTVTADGWTTVEGTFTVPADAVAAEAKLYTAVQPVSGFDLTYYVDDILVTTPVPAEPGKTVISTGFEDGVLDGWSPSQGSASTPPTVAVTTVGPHAGTYAACVTNRQTTNAGIGFDATGSLEPSTAYEFSAWMRFADGQPTDQVVLSANVPGAANEYPNLVSNVGTVGNTWSKVSGTFTTPSFPSTIRIYFETKWNNSNPAHDDNTSDFCIDDIVFSTPSEQLKPDLTNTPIKDTVDFPVGIAVSQPQIEGPAGELTVHHYDQLTAENAMKPYSWYDSAGNFRMDPVAEGIMQLAQDNDMRVYGHTLVWYENDPGRGDNHGTPDWFFTVSPTDSTALTNSAADQAILEQRLKAHIFNVAKTLSDEFGLFGSTTNPMVAFDVVNEAISDNDSPATDGLRNSRWYQILGPRFIDLAFKWADEAFNQTYAAPGSNRPVKLFINDYDFEVNSGKIDRVASRVQALIAAGVPIDGIGTQAHLSGTNSPSVATIVNSLNKLASITNSSGQPILVAVTELDAPACPNAGCNSTPAELTAQGYYYQQLFDAFRKFHADNPGQLFSVAMWGLDDAQSWRSKDSSRAPLPFDGKLQTKPAYCGIVGCELPPLLMTAGIFSTGDTTGDISATAAGVESSEWAKLPLIDIGGVAGFEARWAPDALTVYVSVTDPNQGADDAVTFRMGDQTYVVGRDGTLSGAGASAAVAERGDGYALVITLPLDNAKRGDSVPFDIQVAGAADAVASWNLGGVLGTLNLIQELKFVAVPQTVVAPAIDGYGDDLAWIDAVSVTTPIASTQSGTQPGGAEATVKLTWAGDTLYVLAMVTDPTVSNQSANAYEQDSVEIYLDRGNTKHGSLDNIGITQMRIGADGAVSVGRGGTDAEQRALLTSAAQLTETGYIIEAAISFAGKGIAGSYHGFDVQVNDATGAARTAIHNWADPTDNGYQSAANYGVILLLPLEEVTPDPEPQPVVPAEPEPDVPSGGTIVPAVGGLAAAAGWLLLSAAGLGVMGVRRRMM